MNDINFCDYPVSYTINRVRISRTDPYHAFNNISQFVSKGIKGYICVSNVRTVAFANKNADYCKILNQSLMTLPDGMPLVWMARLWGLKDVKRTTGPDLFVSMLSNPDSGIKHFLLGDTEETLQAIRNKYPDANICGTLSPPFCEVNDFDYEKISQIINKAQADIIWISLRSPKQDYFAVRLLPFLNKGVCIGVGAAFRFAIGKIKHPPMLIKRLGLTGLFWRKNIIKQLVWLSKNSFLLMVYASSILISKMKGKTYNE